MRYLILLDNRQTIRLDAASVEQAASLAHSISPALQDGTAKIADVRAVGTRGTLNGWQAQEAIA